MVKAPRATTRKTLAEDRTVLVEKRLLRYKGHQLSLLAWEDMSQNNIFGFFLRTATENDRKLNSNFSGANNILNAAFSIG